MIPTGRPDLAAVTLFQVRDEYVRLHRTVFQGPVSALFRALRLRREPDYAQIATSCDHLLDELVPVIECLEHTEPLVGHRAAGLASYATALRDAVQTLAVLMLETSILGGPARVSGQTLAAYEMAVAEFDAVAKEVQAG